MVYKQHLGRQVFCCAVLAANFALTTKLLSSTISIILKQLQKFNQTLRSSSKYIINCQ